MNSRVERECPAPNNRVRWAVLGTGRIAADVIPSIKKGEWSHVEAIASRTYDNAKRLAGLLGVPRAYGSYEEALLDQNIEAVYIPLPNHLHVPWAIRAIEAGKHVLCEKPIAMSVSDCRKLIAARNRVGVVVGEAFMVRTHPQWQRARDLVRSGEIGTLTAVTGVFGFYNRDPANIRNVLEFGGGAIWDIGCYPIQIARFLFGEEPESIAALVDRDPVMQIDRLSSILLGFHSGQAAFTCSTQVAPCQRLHILGTTGSIDVEVPITPPSNRNCRLLVGGDKADSGMRVEEFPVCDQYAVQAELFSRAIRGSCEVPTPLEDSIRNTAVLESVFEAARTGRTIHAPLIALE